ncbi:megakaryocyte-associated tyrosine-protein kinase-like [Dendronephthya gigantea]|uniref:megakaryocyte-associated tyrosine-protein kinase-like n=1 Tax=Dendronephthya gigantea TaxID=151771 RepID=UPI00106AD37C|nr:megakaryocyte-associated tyrosine-protein kinase-like [Dendronephthya gigantea]
MSELLWNHGRISKEEAVRRFRQFHPDGSFLMRNSETVMNAFVLSVGFQNNVYHYRILQDTSRRLLFENRIYYSLADIVEYYGKYRGCLVCTLKHPVLPPLPTAIDQHNGYDVPNTSHMYETCSGDRGYENVELHSKSPS